MKKYSVPKNFRSSVGHNSLDNYQSLRENAKQDSNSYWESVAERIDWFDKWTTVNNTDYSKAHIEWFSNGKLNASYNCIDRHIENGLGEKTALIWQSNDPTISTNVSYNELLEWLIKYDDFPAVMKRRVFRLMKIRAKNESQIHKYEYPKYGNYLRGYGEATYYKDSKLRPNKAFNIRQERINLSKLVLENENIIVKSNIQDGTIPHRQSANYCATWKRREE